MAIFNSYVKLPEDIQQATSKACSAQEIHLSGGDYNFYSNLLSSVQGEAPSNLDQ